MQLFRENHAITKKATHNYTHTHTHTHKNSGYLLQSQLKFWKKGRIFSDGEEL